MCLSGHLICVHNAAVPNAAFFDPKNSSHHGVLLVQAPAPLRTWADLLSQCSHNFLLPELLVCKGCCALRCVGIFLVLFSFFLQMQDSKPQQQQKAILLDLFRTRNIATITIMSLLLW